MIFGNIVTCGNRRRPNENQKIKLFQVVGENTAIICNDYLLKAHTKRQGFLQSDTIFHGFCLFFYNLTIGRGRAFCIVVI